MRFYFQIFYVLIISLAMQSCLFFNHLAELRRESSGQMAMVAKI